MANLSKFNSLVGDLGTKKIDLNADSLFILLTNTAPNAADTVVDTTTTPCTVKSTSNAVEIAAGNGYTKKGGAIGSNAYSQTSGTGKLTGNAVTFTASGGAFPTARYAVLFSDTGATSATRPVLGFWDIGSFTLNDGQALKIGKDTSGGNWDSSVPILTIA